MSSLQPILDLIEYHSCKITELTAMLKEAQDEEPVQILDMVPVGSYKIPMFPPALPVTFTVSGTGALQERTIPHGKVRLSTTQENVNAIIGFLKTIGGRKFKAQEVSKETGVPQTQTYLVLRYLRFTGDVTKDGNGHRYTPQPEG